MSLNQDWWQRQTKDKPLFPELEWSRPQNKAFAGKLLIVGGNAHGFAAPAEAFNEAGKAGIGTARVILPSAIQKLVGGFFETADFAPSTPSGSFSKQALASMLEHASWSDGVLLAGDLGRNSETAILLESFTQKYSGQLTITKDAADYFTKNSKIILNRPDTTFAISIAQLQQLATSAKFQTPITFNMDLLRLVDALHDFTQQFAANIIVKHLSNFCVAVNGQVSTTKLDIDPEIWRVKTATHASVWWTHNPSKTFETLSSATQHSLG